MGITNEKYSTLEEYYNGISHRSIYSRCTYCGKCIENCTLLPQTSIKDTDSKKVIEDIIGYLKDGVLSEEVCEKVFKCASCGKCSDSCSLDIDILQIFEAVKMRLAKKGKIPEAVNHVMEIFDMWKVLSAIQISPSEIRWVNKASSSNQKADYLIFLGCTLPAFPHIVFSLLDILDRMNIDYIALAGGDLCCGFPLGPAAGMVAEAENKIKELTANIKAFSPKKVILACAGCYRLFTEMYPKLEFVEMDYEVQYYTEFLREKLKKEDFVKPLNKQIVLHESCMSRRTRVNESTKKLLEAIPGLKIINGGEICCGGTPMITFPELANMATNFIETLSAKVFDTKSDCLSNICQLCGMVYYPCKDKFSFDIIDIPTLVNLSLGGREYENKWLQYYKCKSIDELIDITRNNFEGNGFSEKQTEEILSRFFQLNNS
ncbi:MAG TPA: (Fe-S)-binding protein [Bacteroidales bacterium]|nr:hypothetical protein [Bacteroidales bacterium]HOU96224.1 (Fe-S)-binding protein [Bacteroidales bacterium]HQG37293.1 (Fe-S)-binding protein [Bacteroidales bacterium]HQG52041.1 (Fe-S)-binding protein [Bacteroidales bacterium]HQJ21204.1 (Fe-S)-binding protein [Bacteroidales bacterium]